MIVFLTKYALSGGIDEVWCDNCGVSNLIAVIHDPDNPHRKSYYHKPDWHATREEAVERAEKMRVAKIASHRKSIAKLETLRFT